MRFLVIIILFCFAVLGSAVLAKFTLRGNLEAEMEERALSVLKEAGYKGVEVEFDHLEATLGGFVESQEATGKVVALLTEKLPTAYWPAAGETSITIRPTLAPSLRVTRADGSEKARLEGILASSGEEGRSLLASRLHALPGIGEIENSITFDPQHTPFLKMAEFASLAAGLLAHSSVAEISLAGGKLKVAGTVPNDGIRASLLDLAKEIAGDGVIDEIVVKMPDAFLRSSEFKLTRNRFGITLNGALSSETDKAAILRALQSIQPVPAISDRLAIESDRAPAPWQGALTTVLPVLLKGLNGEMTAEFNETQIRLHGTSPDEGTFRTMEAGLAALGEIQPAMEIIADISIAPPAAPGSAGVSLLAVYEGGLLVLSGRLSDEKLPALIEETLTALIPDLSVKNEVEKVAATPGSDWTARLPEFFNEALSRVTTGTFRFENNRLVMEGRTIALSDKQILQNIAVNTLPANFTIQNDLLHADAPKPKPPLTPELRGTLTTALTEFPIYFEVGSEILTDEEKIKIATLSETLKTANADLSLIVTGVADNKGSAEKNRELSLKRAEAVLAELTRLEVGATAIETAALVENVSNLPRSRQWKARRVEVSLKPAGETAPAPIP